MNTHVYAIKVEHVLRNILGLTDRGGIGGIIDADYIELDILSAITCAIGFIYANGTNKTEEKIAEYLNKYSYGLKFGIDKLLSCKTGQLIEGITTIDLEYNNGKEFLDDAIQDLKTLFDD